MKVFAKILKLYGLVNLISCLAYSAFAWDTKEMTFRNPEYDAIGAVLIFISLVPIGLASIIFVEMYGDEKILDLEATNRVWEIIFLIIFFGHLFYRMYITSVCDNEGANVMLMISVSIINNYAVFTTMRDFLHRH